jgi:hypothetical protein
LVGYVTVFIVEISALSLHWQRWTIPALPIVVLIAADVVVTAATWLAGRVRTRHQRFCVIGATACGLLLVTASPASAVLRLDQRDSGPSTLLAARAWIARNISPSSRIATESKAAGLYAPDYHVVEHYSLPSAGPEAEYAETGFQYAVVVAKSGSVDEQHPRRAASRVRFYNALRVHARVVADFRGSRTRPGPHIEIFRLRSRRPDPNHESPTEEAHDPVSVTQPPVPFATRELARLAATPRARRPKTVPAQSSNRFLPHPYVALPHT